MARKGERSGRVKRPWSVSVDLGEEAYNHAQQLLIRIGQRQGHSTGITLAGLIRQLITAQHRRTFPNTVRDPNSAT